MKYIKQQNKRHFQLLEVMIAIFLIIMCAVPALNIYVNMYRSQSKANIINQRDHLARLTHASIIEDLYKRQIPFESIVAGVEGEMTHSDIKSELDKIGYEAFYRFEVFSHLTEQKMREASSILTDLIITMKRKKFNEIDDIEKNVTHYKYIVYIEREKDGKNIDENKNNNQMNNDHTQQDQTTFQNQKNNLNANPPPDSDSSSFSSGSFSDSDDDFESDSDVSYSSDDDEDD
jgi:hypothetical protein